jgi:hypothetical protein
MIVSISQPAYMPWLGYFNRIAISDLHIVLDNVQFEKRSFTNRNKVRLKNGWTWLTVPVRITGKWPHAAAINKLEIYNESNWAKDHWATLRSCYGKSVYFGEYAPYFEDVYRRHWDKLDDLLRDTSNYLLNAFGIKTQIRFSSEIDVGGRKDELILNLCKAVGATSYLSGPLGKDYIRESLFQEARIKVMYHDYKHPVYQQAFPGFEANMSSVDLLFNCGQQGSKILMSGQESIAP